MFTLVLRALGWPFTLLVCDPATFDRWVWLKRNLKRGDFRTLDAGCGTGSFTMYAAKLGNEAVGISFDARNNNAARDRARVLGIGNVRFIDGDLRKLDAVAEDLGTFDQVICFETIEHILDDRKLLRDFHAVLKPGGRVLITTPYLHYRPFPGEVFSVVEDGGHVRRGYTFESMRALLRGVGFEVEKEEYATGVVSQYLCRILKFFNAWYANLGWLLSMPLRIFQVFDRPLTALFHYPDLSICVVARKV